MKSSGLSLSIEESSYLSSLFDDGDGGEQNNDGQMMGGYLEVELDVSNKKDCHRSSANVGGKGTCSMEDRATNKANTSCLLSFIAGISITSSV